MRVDQPDLFGSVPEKEPLSRIAHYGMMDARTGGWNYHSNRLTGEARAVYEAAFRSERERMLSEVSPG